MDPITPLWQAHDLVQQLQDKIELLPNVDRAFVHVDHETTHTPVGRFLPNVSGHVLNSPIFQEHRKLILT